MNNFLKNKLYFNLVFLLFLIKIIIFIKISEIIKNISFYYILIILNYYKINELKK